MEHPGGKLSPGEDSAVCHQQPALTASGKVNCQVLKRSVSGTTGHPLQWIPTQCKQDFGGPNGCILRAKCGGGEDVSLRVIT